MIFWIASTAKAIYRRVMSPPSPPRYARACAPISHVSSNWRWKWTAVVIPAWRISWRGCANCAHRRKTAPDAAPPPGGARVRLMTIHAAKGLEAQVVILADTGPVKNRSKAYQALVDWPASADRPRHFLLTAGKDTLDAFSRQRLAEQQLAEQREEANLLYVALTRAKRVLIVSCASEDQDSWYNLIKAPLSVSAVTAADGTLALESGPLPAPVSLAASTTVTTTVIDPRLGQCLAPMPEDAEIAPSHGAGESSTALIEEDGLLRGRAIHRFLELLCKAPRTTDAHTLRARVAEELGLHAEDAESARVVDRGASRGA